MKISELKEGTTNVEIEARVVQLGEVRQVNTRFGPRQVSDNVLKDDSGEVKLTLWGDDIQKVKIGDTVKITGGYVKAWQGDLQLSVGRNGAMIVESGVAAEGAEAAEAPEEAGEPAGEPSAEAPAAEEPEPAAEETEGEAEKAEPESGETEPEAAEAEKIEEVKIK